MPRDLQTGISFHGWSLRPGYERYFHPFQTALDSHTAPQFFLHTRERRTGRDVVAHPDVFFVSTRLAAERRAPIAPPSIPFDIGYGYHFDATLVGQFLRDHAVGKLGVMHLARTVRDVALDTDGNVASLVCDDDERIAGDFFIDASGFRAAIIQQALGERFRPFAENLFNDRAVAMPTPNDPGVLPCETRATALSAGWVWNIPLTNRTGNGYVYSSAHLTEDQAERELRAHLGVGKTGPPARHLNMKVGRVERSWVKNCLAVGLSQGFIEPLEATALHIVQATVEGYLDAVEHDGGRDDFNKRIAARYEGIRDYIVAHYRFNSRTDSEYWRANAAQQNLSDSLKELMTCWFTGGDLGDEIARQDISKYYAPLSWNCLMAGYGAFPDDTKMRAAESGLPLADMMKIERFFAGCASNFPSHDVVLAALG